MTAETAYSIDWLLAHMAGGSRPDFLFFWGHRGKPDRVTKACFSQWWPAGFTVDGLHYPTTEHWMMAEKARLFGSDAIAAQILREAEPKAVKALGRKVEGFDAATWDARKMDIVVAGNTHKFGQNPALRDFLLATGDQVLVEASPVDPVWGIGLAADHPDAATPARWRGENLLGFALMRVRDRRGG